jgi:hypothetical protein
MWNLRSVSFAFALALCARPLVAQTPPAIKLNGGLEATIINIGRNSNHTIATISMKISNKGSNAAHLLLVGTPVVTDDTGGVLSALQSISGLASCRWAFAVCIGVPRVSVQTVGLEEFTLIDPGIDITVNFVFASNRSSGPRISLAADVAYRFGSREIDANTPEADKRKQIRKMTLSFPPIMVNEGK